MTNFLITILTSYNELILYDTFLSVYNQINHKLRYTIVIIVNSKNPEYYKNVCKICISVYLFITFLLPEYAQTVKNWFSLGPCNVRHT